MCLSRCARFHGTPAKPRGRCAFSSASAVIRHFPEVVLGAFDRAFIDTMQFVIDLIKATCQACVADLKMMPCDCGVLSSRRVVGEPISSRWGLFLRQSGYDAPHMMRQVAPGAAYARGSDRADGLRGADCRKQGVAAVMSRRATGRPTSSISGWSIVIHIRFLVTRDMLWPSPK